MKVAATSCPFCATALGITAAPVARLAMGLALGLTLSGCFDDKEPADTAGTDTTAASSGGEGPGMSSTDPGEATSVTSLPPPNDDQGGDDYGGFGDTFWEPEPTTATDGSTGTGGATGTSGDTSGATDEAGATDSTGGTDTGDSTTGEVDAGGEDYAGPEPEPF